MRLNSQTQLRKVRSVYNISACYRIADRLFNLKLHLAHQQLLKLEVFEVWSPRVCLIVAEAIRPEYLDRSCKDQV